MKKTLHRGYLMLLALVFGAVFLSVFGGLSLFVLSENRLQSENSARGAAFSMAEAGLEYYHWHLAHFPSDVQNGTGAAGPYVIPYTDPETGTTTGSVSLAITGNTSCGQVTSVDLASTGIPAGNTNATRTIKVRYSRPSVATYSYILNSSVWAGSDRVILGPYHSNGGIRMDGTANSPVTSSLSTWSCDSNYGCSPTQSSAPGVVGTGPNQTLWDYPTSQVDFSAISANFGNLKTIATASGRYLARVSTGTSGANANKGYHLTFNSDGTVTIRQVTAVTALTPQALINSADAATDYTLISTQGSSSSYTIPASCGLIFVEDNVWIDGTVKGKVTLVAANVVNAGVAPNAILKGNISYADTSSGLAVIAENDVLVAADSPSDMSISGVFIAQNGAFGRNLYACPSSYEPRNSLTILGTTVSNLRTGTKWTGVSGCGTAGYQSRIDSFDRRLSTDPPPFTPVVSTDYKFVSWSED